MQSITSSGAAKAAQARSSLSNRRLLDTNGRAVDSRSTLVDDANSIAALSDSAGGRCVPPLHIGAWLVGGAAGWVAIIKALPMALDGFGAVFP